MEIAPNPWEKEVTSYLTAHPKVTLAFLFGSAVRGRTRTDSDVDLSVYLSEPYSDEDVSSIWGKIEDLTHRDVDLIVLNSAPPGIAWTSMQGKTLVNRNPQLRLDLMLEKSAEAEDFRELLIDLLKKRRAQRGDEHANPET